MKPEKILTFQSEPVSVVLNATDLWTKHYEEIALHRDHIPLDPNLERYLEVEKVGILRTYTARLYGELVGYSVFFVTPHMHYRQTTFAVNDVLYVDPAHRKTRAGIGLIRESERLLKADGVQKIIWHVKPLMCDFGPLLERLGYGLEDVLWGKWVGD